MIQTKRRKWKLKAFSVLLVLVAIFGFRRWFFGPTIVLGARTVEVLQDPHRVEVLKLSVDSSGMDATASGNTRNVIGGRKIVAVGEVLSKESTLRLGRVLTERNAHLPQIGFSLCRFDPGLAFRFSEGSAKVTVSACYSCQKLWFLTTDKNQITQHFMAWDVNELKPVFQQGFPQDERLFNREEDSAN